ncbi:hypothetical protein BCV02_08015 [Vibrio breoganii]|uniref:DUF2057 domain-containing protein n=1 Tax=Vibrio breoganii TaxID=553239 RepID=A0ABX1U7G8_9VIBR|nr:DUF2057 family protein [Vibrio breoganii]NMO73018.1 DUF2057 domain-containing protein [Vibrio breoganii]NMR69305.1 DUF2057 domain-containing protein [Vibrio breoganii]OEF84176.1 hypothetical protein B003_17475 [Vibrio breoganii 1C10]PMG03509.1 hypothetical protein BCV02_08015 [Vibrio breoganii]PML92037.1 hypothetical protein BCT67_02820 [Vibrio breoganii]
MVLIKNNKWVLASLAMALGGCSTLDSSSDFSNSVANVDTRLTHIQVTGRDFQPNFIAKSGSNILKSSLSLTDNYPIDKTSAPTSYIEMEVSYFQNYDEYKTSTYNGLVQNLTRTKPSSSSCNEHCTATQYFRFPIDQEQIEIASSQGLSFELTSTNKGMRTQFDIPAAYIETIHKTAELNARGVVLSVDNQAANSKPEPKAKSNEMLEYWYNEAKPEDQNAFTDWAFKNRTEIGAKLDLSNKPVEMMTYWYEKASLEERKKFLTWLLDQ